MFLLERSACFPIFLHKNPFYVSREVDSGYLSLGNDADQYDQIFAALKHPVRRQILSMLEEKGEASFTEVQSATDLHDTGLLSYHLKELAPLITQTERGKYKLSDIGVASMTLFHKVERDKHLAYETFRINVGRLAREIIALLITASIALLPLSFLNAWLETPSPSRGDFTVTGWTLVGSILTFIGMIIGLTIFVFYDRHYYSKRAATNALHGFLFALGTGGSVLLYIFYLNASSLIESMDYRLLFPLPSIIIIVYVMIAPVASYAWSRFLNSRTAGQNAAARIGRRMRLLIGLLIIGLIIITLLISSLWWLSVNENFVFSRKADVEPFAKEEETYSANITDGGKPLAGITMRLAPDINGSDWFPFYLTISPYRESEIDSFGLTLLTGPTPLYVFLNTSSFTVITGNYFRGAQVTSSDLGSNGTNVLNLALLLRIASSLPEPPYVQGLSVTVELTMHRIAFIQMTGLTAEASLSFTVEL